MILLGAVAVWSCEETPEPSGPCEDSQWATATLNGEAHCMGKVEVNYFHANTTSAKIILTARNEGPSLTPEIDVEFAIPVEGVALNTPYPVSTGKIYDADEITEGSLTLLVFDPPTQLEAGCIAGTFTLKAGINGTTTFNYTDGRFVYFRKTVQQSDQSSVASLGCNPFI